MSRFDSTYEGLKLAREREEPVRGRGFRQYL